MLASSCPSFLLFPLIDLFLVNFLQANEPTASRCETVLNTTMAEMDVYHEQKIEDVKMLVGDYLDGEIALYEQVCGFFFGRQEKTGPFFFLCITTIYLTNQLIDPNPSQICKQQSFLSIYHLISISSSSPTFNPRKRSGISQSHFKLEL